MRWITPQDPSWAETMAAHRRHQEYHRRKNHPIWKDGPMTTADYTTIVKNAPTKAANIIGNWKAKVAEINGNPVIPEAGQLHLIGEATQEALNEIQKLNEQQAVAADLARKALAHQRDQKRPKVDNGTHERKARQMLYLVEKGISVETLIRDYGQDPQLLAILADEAPIFARAESPLDPKAAEGVQAMIEQAAYQTFGDDYRAKADELSAFQQGAYRSQVAMAAALRQIRNQDRGEFVAPSYQDGQLVEA
jgi:hypothetical protein